MPGATASPDFAQYLINKKARRAKETEEEKGPAMKAREGFLFGADPEFFLVDDKGVIVPGTPDIIPGTKDGPYKVNKGAVQLDGIAAEINIDPAPTFEEWSYNLGAVINQLREMLPKGWSLSTQASHVFDKDVFDAVPEDCKILGCTPDFNAWDLSINPPPEITDPYLRCIGGHIHVGWDKGLDVTDVQHTIACADLAKQLDWYLAYWALTVDQDKRRRELYGKAGACRIKPYGMEYRTLSSFWVLDKELQLQVWNRMQLAIRNMSERFLPDRAGSKWNTLLVDGINSGVTNKDMLQVGYYPIMNLDWRNSRL